MLFLPIVSLQLSPQLPVSRLLSDAGFKLIPQKQTEPQTGSLWKLYRRETDKASLTIGTSTHPTQEVAQRFWSAGQALSSGFQTKPKMLESGKGIGDKWIYDARKGAGGIFLDFVSDRFLCRVWVEYFGIKEEHGYRRDDTNLASDRKLVEAIGRQLIVEQAIKP